MVAIGLLVNCNVLDVCVSKCGPILVVRSVVVGADIYTDTHACCHVASLQIKAGYTGTALEGQEVSWLWLNRSCTPPVQYFSHHPDL